LETQAQTDSKKTPVPSYTTLPGIAELEEPPVPSRLANKGKITEKITKPTPVKEQAKPSVLAGMLQSLMAELSVRWLLFLGMFLVVVSSGVLAASQWDRFPVAGQYGILFSYTLSFWGFSFWTGKQPNLRLTTQSLLIVTLLLVPVNFWAMDSFGLLLSPISSFINWLVVAIAAITLLSITVLISDSRQFVANLPNRKLRLINILALSFLHWGWKIPAFPIIALYIAMVGTSFLTLYQTRLAVRQQNQQNQFNISLPTAIVIYALLLLLYRGIFVVGLEITQLGLAIGICGWLVTWLAQNLTPYPSSSSLCTDAINRVCTNSLLRRDAINRVSTNSLLRTDAINRVSTNSPLRTDAINRVSTNSLLRTDAINRVSTNSPLRTDAINRVSTNSPLPHLWELSGGILLFLGWVVTVGTRPEQALSVSALALLFFYRRLQSHSLQGDFTAIFFIGLQSIWLTWRLVPVGFREVLIATTAKLINSQYEPWALLSVALFPYVILMVVFTQILRSQGKRKVANYGEQLTLAFGAVLTTLSLVNPALRSINLLLSTLVLAFITTKSSSSSSSSPSPHSPLPYLTHITGLLTLCAGIDWLLPLLTTQIWTVILLGLMVAEWLFSTTGSGVWQSSARYIGFALAFFSYILLWVNAAPFWTSYSIKVDYWGLIWLVTPLTLTIVASRVPPQRNTNSLFSIAALIVAQLLVLPIPGARLIALGVGFGLMLVNTNYLRNIESALITEGFALSLLGVTLWELRLGVEVWFIVGSLTVLGLWVARGFNRRPNPPTPLPYEGRGESRNNIGSLYASAADWWAIIICGVELLSLTAHSLLLYNQVTTPGLLYVVATAITLGAILFRSWQQPNDWAFYSIGWTLELLVAQLLGFSTRSLINITVANIALGLATQLFGEWWKRRHGLEKFPGSLHILPLLYGGFSVLLRLNTFTSWTGLYTLGVALIVISIGRRHRDLKPLVYLGLIGISIGSYELLLYQMLQARGGAFGDGLIAMSALGTSIMYAYRILTPWLIQYLRLTPQEITAVAHFHWIWSSGLLIASISSPIQVNRLLGLGTGAFLIRYAIFQGRRPNPPTPFPTREGGEEEARRKQAIFSLELDQGELWVYLGLLQFLFMRIFWRETAVGQFITGPLRPWNAAIACIVAYFLYILPWERWGWSKRPWQIAAYIAPVMVLWETWQLTYPITIIITALFYTFLAKLNQNWRFTYISVALVDWALLRWFNSLGLTDSLWYVTPIGLSLLYIAQIDPEFIDPKLKPEFKPTRHILRILGSGLICGMAVVLHIDTPIIPGVLSLIAIFAGLALRVRAYLYVGTGAFLITSIYQLVILSLRYPFLKWVIGLVMGIILISIAANFETRREQLSSLLRNTDNDEWE
jgi:hypothetical protein